MSFKIALIGNPNTGKTTLFNKLSGLHQHTGNYSGVTVEKKVGFYKHSQKGKIAIIDFPGTYSIYPSSYDEEIVRDTLLNPEYTNFPDAIIVVVDASQIKRNLLLFEQIRDLGVPTVMALNMMEEAEKQNTGFDVQVLEKELQCAVVQINARTGENIKELINTTLNAKSTASTFKPSAEFTAAITKEKGTTTYVKWLKFAQKSSKQIQLKETVSRYQYINTVLKKLFSEKEDQKNHTTSKIDTILTHRFWGYVVFLTLLFFVFQAVYTWSAYPMDFIDNSFGKLADFFAKKLPEGPIQNLITNGIIPGIGGIIIFIPQIAILFLFLALMEESGYMSRVVYLMDKMMRKVGMSGRSVVPLMSGLACAIPGIMASRTIKNRKERLITMMVTPFMTCAARLPVYTGLIAVIIPDEKWYGFSLQGITLLGLYLFGILLVIGSALVLRLFIKAKHKSYLLLELPTYKIPVWTDVFQTVFQKSKQFVFNAGKIIFAVSILLWALASFSWDTDFYNAKTILKNDTSITLSDTELEDKIASFKLEHSVLGKLGKVIEPVVKPLGYDWKMGIAIISSIAAREVFVGTMATIYNLGSEGEEDGIVTKINSQVNPETGKKVFTFAVGMSLLLFYAIAMQCISTVAIICKETQSWAWTLGQFTSMTILAYVVAYITYQILK